MCLNVGTPFLGRAIADELVASKAGVVIFDPSIGVCAGVRTCQRQDSLELVEGCRPIHSYLERVCCERWNGQYDEQRCGSDKPDQSLCSAHLSRRSLLTANT